ncbi:hypothetical protein ACSDR0_37080 [Streptosporangium sp. G11]|uniref:hypothetical protein n=1 Tax=Streptosporangium sp. G11 TaxID=3436926 RepID=UPI003EBC1DF6
MPRKEKFEYIMMDRLRASLDLVGAGAYGGAARQPRLTDASIRGHVKILKDNAYNGRPIFTESNGRQVLTDPGGEPPAYARQVVDLGHGVARSGSSESVTAFLPRRSRFVSRALLALRDEITVHCRVPGDRDRHEDVFEIDVIGPPENGVIDLVLGPPPPRPGKHEAPDSPGPYTGRLEATVPISDPLDAISLEQPVSGGPSPLAPSGSRSPKPRRG